MQVLKEIMESVVGLGYVMQCVSCVCVCNCVYVQCKYLQQHTRIWAIWVYGY